MTEKLQNTFPMLFLLEQIADIIRRQKQVENLLIELTKLLDNDRQKRFVTDDGELLKNKIVECVDKLDKELLELLLSNEYIRNTYFVKIGDVFVLREKEFKRFVNNKFLLKDSYTAFKQKIGLYKDDKEIKQNDDYVLCWPYKDCILEGGQTKEDEKRKEIFWNVTLSPNEVDKLLAKKVFTNFKRVTTEGEKPLKDIDLTKDNLIIKGNNLLALHSLKEMESVRGKVKLIYIDPPYNTGSDTFSYNDSFTHSTWLTFMKNRLEVARELLSDDGVIFVQCDDNEQAYLKVLCDEVFPYQINTISVKSSTPSGVKTAHAKKTILKSQDFILSYKMKRDIVLTPQYYKKDKWDTHYMFYIDRENNILRNLLEVLQEKNILSKTDTLSNFDINNVQHKQFYLANGENIVRKSTHNNQEVKSICNTSMYIDKLYFNKENNYYYFNNDMLQPISNSFHYFLDGLTLRYDISNVCCDFWDDIDFQNTQNQGGVSFPAGKKPEQLLYRIISMTTQPNDLVLDFFCGSGTTAAVAHKMNRRYIGVEQLDGQIEMIQKRLKYVIDGEQGGISRAVNWNGGGEFVYMELSCLNENLRKEISQAQDNKTLNDIFDKMQKSKNLRLESEEITKEIFYSEQEIENKRKLLLELIDYNQLYHNYSEIEDEDYQISKEDKEVNRQLYRK